MTGESKTLDELPTLIQIKIAHSAFLGFPGGSDGKESACNAGDTGSIPGSGRSPQYSCLENPVDRGARWTTVQGVAKSQPGWSD